MSLREKLNVLVFSEPKVGKTTFAVRRNPNVLILDTEGSSRSIKGVKREVVMSMAKMDEVLRRIKSGEVKQVVVDTIDELVNNFAKNEIKAKGGNNVQGNGQLSQQGWGVMRERVLGLFRQYRDAGADVLVLCHAELEELPQGGKKWTMKLPSDYAREIMGMFDIVGFLEVRRNGEGKDVRQLNLQKTAMYDAGYRAVYDATTDEFKHVIPSVIEDPAFVDILTAYDKFFDGTTEGFTAKCSNCLKKGIEADAKHESEVGLLCEDCNSKYKEMKKPKEVESNTASVTQ